MNQEEQVKSDLPSTVLTVLSKQPQKPNKTAKQSILKLTANHVIVRLAGCGYGGK